MQTSPSIILIYRSRLMGEIPLETPVDASKHTINLSIKTNAAENNTNGGGGTGYSGGGSEDEEEAQNTGQDRFERSPSRHSSFF